MDSIINNGFDRIGIIDDHGNVYDSSYNQIARINSNGDVLSPASTKTFCKIEPNGLIRDVKLKTLNDSIGRIYVNGDQLDIHIHGKRVCTVSSSYLKKLVPDAIVLRAPSTSAEPESTTYSSEPADEGRSFPIGLIVKLIIGVILGIILIVSMAIKGVSGFWVYFLAIPVTVALVFLVSFIFKLFKR